MNDLIEAKEFDRLLDAEILLDRYVAAEITDARLRQRLGYLKHSVDFHTKVKAERMFITITDLETNKQRRVYLCGFPSTELTDELSSMLAYSD